MQRDPYADIPAAPEFQLTSSTVADAATMPVPQRSGVFGAGGQDESPELSWSGFSDTTRSFIVTMYDPDAPTPSGFWHWGVVDLPVDVTSLPLGAGEGDQSLPAGRHIIVVTALDIPTVDVPETASPALTLFQTLGNVVGRARLVPTFGT